MRLEEYLVESARSAVLYLVTLEEAVKRRMTSLHFYRLEWKLHIKLETISVFKFVEIQGGQAK